MEEIVAYADNIRFDIEEALIQQSGALPLPFPGMDKLGSSMCDSYIKKGFCDKGNTCPFRHLKAYKTIVCKYWLRGLCKKGDKCEFLHKYDMKKMPICHFYSTFNACNKKGCLFLHVKPKTKIKDCPWYNRGFCKNGPKCWQRHTRRVICANYVSGFCMEGPNCKFMHPKFDLPVQDPTEMQTINCHYCSETGHKVIVCPNMPAEFKEDQLVRANMNNNQAQLVNIQLQDGLKARYRPIDQVTCYKCGEKGHYANRCSKGYLAFLSLPLQTTEAQP